MKHNSKQKPQQTVKRNGGLMDQELMQQLELPEFSTSSPQTGGRKSSESFNVSEIYSPSDLSSENSTDSEHDDQQIREEAKNAVKFETNLMDFHIEQFKNECDAKVESLRRVKIEVKEELGEVRDENNRLQHQVGFNDGRANFLARENEKLKRQLVLERQQALESQGKEKELKRENERLKMQLALSAGLDERENGGKNKPSSSRCHSNDVDVGSRKPLKFKPKRIIISDSDSENSDDEPERVLSANESDQHQPVQYPDNELGVEGDKLLDVFEAINNLTDENESITDGHMEDNDEDVEDFLQDDEEESIDEEEEDLESEPKKQCDQNEERPHSCDLCKKRFKLKGNLQIHRRIHTGEKPYKCNECGKAFVQQATLNNHLTTHTGERPFACNECGKSFTQQAHLDSHYRTHTGERPFACDKCEKSFTQQSGFTYHIQTHIGEKSHKCDLCGKAYTCKSYLNHHRKLKHPAN